MAIRIKSLLLTVLILLVMTVVVQSVALADDNETSTTTVTATGTYDTGYLIILALVFGGIVTLGFVISELVGMYVTKSAQTSIVNTTTTGVNAIVAMTTLAVTAAQGASVAEISGVPTQIVSASAEKAKTA